MLESTSMPSKTLDIFPLRLYSRDIVQITQRLNSDDFAAQKEKGADSGAIGIVTTFNKKIVLVERTKPHKGWALPGGRVEKNEDFELALIRELQEECGVKVKITGLATVEHKIFVSPTDEKLPFWLAVFTGTTNDVPQQTEEAKNEGLNVCTFPLASLPDVMVLKDKEKIIKYALSR